MPGEAGRLQALRGGMHSQPLALLNLNYHYDPAGNIANITEMAMDSAYWRLVAAKRACSLAIIMNGAARPPRH